MNQEELARLEHLEECIKQQKECNLLISKTLDLIDMSLNVLNDRLNSIEWKLTSDHEKEYGF